MAYSATAVANAFIEKAAKGQIPDLTPMKLQKLIFYAQSWHLKLYDEPLIDDFFSKWKYGPVIPSLYHEVKGYGSQNISALISVIINTENGYAVATPKLPDSDARTKALLEKISSVYGPLRGTQLSHLTHLPGTAWTETETLGDVIPNSLMKEKIK
ncbi:type II toxin-antitoxin system antitoxin SocA domain-containing protein [Pantoea sp.]|uniref:Panacea domain-containing protein n=1 Tax=Pantoea sp. TaxID=69393 RepID=UPI0028AF1896|nr:type II toxin-antitoxin system antitoxin SocA domain-containing protein [Pantoea sp.]